MIPFEIEKLRVEHVWLKSCTTALGGSIIIVDEDRSTDKKEVYTKLNVPMAVARTFIKVYEVSKYLKPVLTAVTFYDNHVVALERHPLGNLGQEVSEGLFGEEHWISESEKNLDRYIMNATAKGEWYVDGAFLYSFDDDAFEDASNLSSDGRFRAVQVDAIKLASIHSIKQLQVAPRVCLQYVAANGKSAMTPPIWKKLDTVGGRQLERADEDEVGIAANDHQFDRIDQFLSVNLSFALNAARRIADIFGYDAVEPLALDDLMVQLRTVNLPNVPKSVKETFDIGMPFTHATAWLIGLTNRTETLESYMVLRSLLKHLTTKGIYRKGAFDPKSVYQDGASFDAVPMFSRNELEEKEVAWDLERQLLINEMQRPARNGVGSVGNLYDAE